jgi:hypothetical protein
MFLVTWLMPLIFVISGYAFTRIQDDSAAIVGSLLRLGHPFDVPPDSPRYQLYDAILLDLMAGQGEAIGPIFTAARTICRCCSSSKHS